MSLCVGYRDFITCRESFLTPLEERTSCHFYDISMTFYDTTESSSSIQAAKKELRMHLLCLLQRVSYFSELRKVFSPAAFSFDPKSSAPNGVK